MLNYVKTPRSVAEFTLMKGVTDFSNMRQFDLYETSYGFLFVCAVPKFMDILGNRNAKVRNLQDMFVHIVEGEFKGIDGIPDITADAGTISNGVNEVQIINNVTQDTSIQVSMSYYERSGGALTNYITTFLTGIKDPNSKAKTYHGLIADGTITDPGPDYEVFTLLYMVTDNTCRKLEKAYLLANAQPTSAPTSTLYNMQRGNIEFPEISITFNCFPITGDRVNLYAGKLLEYSLDYAPASERLILDSNDFEYAVFNRSVEGGNSIVASKINTVSTGTIAAKYSDAKK